MNVRAQIIVRKANIAVYFSPVIRDSITFLDLSICEYSLFQGRSLERNRKLAFLWKTYFRSKGDSKREWSDRNHVMYRLHLNTPNRTTGRRRRHSENFMEEPLDLTSSRLVFDDRIFLETLYSFIIYKVERADRRSECIRRHLQSARLLFRENEAICQMLWRSFLDNLYGEQCNDTNIVREFVESMPFWMWILSEELEVLEYLLLHAGHYIIRILETRFDDDLINYFILKRRFQIIPSFFKYCDMPRYDATRKTYAETINRVSFLFFVGADELTRPVISGQLTERRNFQLLQLFQLYMDRPLGPQQEISELAFQVMRLICISTTDPCISLDEIVTVYGSLLGEERLRLIHRFYIDAIPAYHHIKPLTWLCRVTLRRRMRENGQLPLGIDRPEWPRPLKEFLKLDL